MSEFYGDSFGESAWNELEGWTLQMASQTIQTLSQKLDASRARFGWHSREVVESLRDIADHLYNHGQKSESLSKLQDAISIMRDLKQQEDITLSSLIDRMATVLTEEGKFLEAFKTLEEGVSIRRTRMVVAMEDLAETLVNAGNACRWGGMHPEALSRFEQALDLFRRANPDGESIHEAATMHKVGNELALLGRLPDALGTLSHALSIQQRSLGIMDRDVALTLDSLGGVLSLMQRKEEALKRHREALKIHQWHRTVCNMHGPVATDPVLRESLDACIGIVTSTLSIAVLLDRMRRHEEAELQYGEAIKASREALSILPQGCVDLRWRIWMREHPELAKVLLYKTKGGGAPDVSAVLSTAASAVAGEAARVPTVPPIAPVA